MEVFQMNQEQKNQIESLCEEKTTFAKKYEMEFNLMSVRYYYALYFNLFLAIMNHLFKRLSLLVIGLFVELFYT